MGYFRLRRCPYRWTIVLRSRRRSAEDFNVKDGTAIKAIQAMGIKFGVVSGRSSDALQKRSDELGFDFCYMGVENKAAVIRELRQEHQIPKNQVLFVGDDVNDCSAREECGLLYAVNDAAEEPKKWPISHLKPKEARPYLKKF